MKTAILFCALALASVFGYNVNQETRQDESSCHVDCEKSYTEEDLDKLDSLLVDSELDVTDVSSVLEHDIDSGLCDVNILSDIHLSQSDISFIDSDNEGSIRSYTEEDLDSLSLSLAESEPAFRNVLHSSTPHKNTHIDSSFNEEDWKSFLCDQNNEDESFDIDSDTSVENDSEMELSFSVLEKSNVATIDPDFYGEVYAAPRKLVLSKGHSSRESLLMKKALNKKNILKSKRTSCKCGTNCVNSVSAKDVYHIRERFWTVSRYMQSQFLIQTLSQRKVEGRYSFLRLDNGLTVCKRAYGIILNIDKKRFTSINKLIKRKAKAAADKSPRCVSLSTISAMTWLQNYAKERGDRMPHSTDILLPYKTTKTAVYQAYRRDCDKRRPNSRSHFFQLWKDHFPHLKIKEVNTFSMCSKCAWIEKKLEQKLIPSERRLWLLRRAAHLERQKLERLHYYAKRDLSRADPENYLSLIIDGMDQSKSSLPHFTGRQSKSINPADLLKTHITGVINHGQRSFSTFVDINQWPHDPNLTINILLLCLQKSILKNGKLPKTLYWQADNCWRENKNKYTLGFCELLVRERIFEEVQLSFLFVGHTHEDVDAGFSQIAKTLRQQDVETLNELIEMLPNGQELEFMFDVKSWLEPHLVEPKKHTQPLHFRFQSVGDNDVTVHHKRLFNHPWQDYESGFFKSYINGKKYLPSGTPKQLPPDLERVDLERIKRQIRTLSHLFSNPEKNQWWNSFLSSLSNRKTQKRGQWILKMLPKRTKADQIEDLSIEIPPELQKLLDIETSYSVMTVVKKSLIVQTRKRNKKGTQRKKTSRPNQKRGQNQRSQQRKIQNVQGPPRKKKTSQQPSRQRKQTKQPTRSRCFDCEGDKSRRKEPEKRTIVYYFNGHNEQKRHIWFNILFECFANLVLSYGALLKLIELYQLLYFGFTMIDLGQFFTVICALSMLLENQRSACDHSDIDIKHQYKRTRLFIDAFWVIIMIIVISFNVYGQLTYILVCSHSFLLVSLLHGLVVETAYSRHTYGFAV